MGRGTFAAMLLAMSIGSGPALSDGAAKFTAMEFLEDEPLDIDPQLFGGRAAKRSEWPATSRSEFKTPKGEDEFCTSNFIGRRVAITAAHCLNQNKTATFKISNELKIIADCEAHPKYVPDDKVGGQFDVALCLLEERVDLQPFETVGLSEAAALTTHEEILLTGFGCDDLKASKLSKIYQIGFATASHIPEAKSKYPSGLNIIAMSNPKPKSETSGGAILCAGDSGGGVFKLKQAKNLVSGRTIVGINTWFSKDKETKELKGLSLFSATYISDTRDFILGWLTANSQEGFVCTDENRNSKEHDFKCR